MIYFVIQYTLVAVAARKSLPEVRSCLAVSVLVVFQGVRETVIGKRKRTRTESFFSVGVELEVGVVFLVFG